MIERRPTGLRLRGGDGRYAEQVADEVHGLVLAVVLGVRAVEHAHVERAIGTLRRQRRVMMLMRRKMIGSCCNTTPEQVTGNSQTKLTQ